MKKSLLNIAVSMAVSSAVFSGTVLSTQAYADETAAADLTAVDQITVEQVPVNEDISKSDTVETYMLPGMGLGAATGTVVAGPVGLLVGSIIGAFIGSNQETESGLQQETNTELTSAEDVSLSSNNPVTESAALNNNGAFPIDSTQKIQLAQLGRITPVDHSQSDTFQDGVIKVLTSDLSMDVYFRSGSTDIETFYPARLTAIAELMKTIDSLELHLDGYTDRRGNKAQNIALANQRIEKVREQLIQAGVEDNRIVSKAFGEMKMVSRPGDLDAYTFDRKVVIRFEQIHPDSLQSMTNALSGTADDGTAASDSAGSDASLGPVVADAETRF